VKKKAKDSESVDCFILNLSGSELWPGIYAATKSVTLWIVSRANLARAPRIVGSAHARRMLTNHGSWFQEQRQHTHAHCTRPANNTWGYEQTGGHGGKFEDSAAQTFCVLQILLCPENVFVITYSVPSKFVFPPIILKPGYGPGWVVAAHVIEGLTCRFAICTCCPRYESLFLVIRQDWQRCPLTVDWRPASQGSGSERVIITEIYCHGKPLFRLPWANRPGSRTSRL